MWGRYFSTLFAVRFKLLEKINNTYQGSSYGISMAFISGDGQRVVTVTSALMERVLYG